jgi:hypothetical protein
MSFFNHSKSKTTATDGEHMAPLNGELPTHDEIAERAHQRWLQNGCPNGSQEKDWLEAERELHDAALSRRLTEMNYQKGGSVQN